MDADGSNPTNLTNDPLSADHSPAWSPDGTQIAFWANRVGNAEIYVMDADGSNQTNRTNTSGTDEHPVWSPEPPEAVPAISSNGKMALVFLMAGLAAIALFGRQQSWRAGRIREGS